MTERCDFLVIGTGNIAKRHIANLRKLHREILILKTISYLFKKESIIETF